MIVPGSANAMLLANAGDPLDELGKIEKSLRLRAAASGTLTKALAASNTTKWSWRWCGKRCKFGALQYLNYTGDGASNSTSISFTAADQLDVNLYVTGYVFRLVTNRVFRDPAAHFDILVVLDTNNATAADRVQIFVSGVRETSFSVATYPTLGQTTHINGASYAHSISYAQGLYDGLLSFIAFVDGQALTPSSFGQFHPRTGQWRPKSRASVKAVVDTGGVNSFFLPFDDATSLATLTADASSKGNNWTANNISLTAGVTYDSMLDTPTNNLPVINPNWAIYGTIAGTISEGNLKFTSSTTYHFTPCTIPLPSKGKWQCEFIPQDTVSIVGLADLDNGAGSSQNLAGGYGWYGSTLYTGNAVAAQSGLATMAANDKVTVCADMDALSMKIYKNNVLVCTQALSASKRYAFACGDYYAPGGTSCYANFGQYAITYPQAGYQVLSTKNLPVKPDGPMKSSSAFVAVADSGANIVATLAAARSGWSDYIDIIKRRDAAEGWRWIFSDDASFYVDSSSNAAKAAVPAFGGTSYVGYSLKVSAANGIATGRLTHVNGVADVVADGLSNARKVVILKNESTGSWYLYHPELTAGRLLYLEQTAGETVDATISAVTSSGFTVAAALASGTYRWISIAELDGFCKLGYDTGNGSADGVFDSFGLSPAMMIRKAVPGGTRWINWDIARNPNNLTNHKLNMNYNVAEDNVGATWNIDMLANGFKLREYTGGDTEFNYPGYKFIGITFAAFPFRYANAR